MHGRDIQFLRKHMVLFNIKNRKGIFFSETLLYLIFIVIILLTTFGIFFFVNTTTNEVEEITLYTPIPSFHKTTIISFLEKEVELDNDQRRNLGLDESYQKLKIKDLLYIDSIHARQIVANSLLEYRNSFSIQENTNSPLYNYLLYYQDRVIDIQSNSLIDILYDQQSLPDLLTTIRNNNFYYFIKTKDDKLTIIFFRRPQQ